MESEDGRDAMLVIGSQEFADYLAKGAANLKLRQERIAFLRWNPEMAMPSDVRFLAERINLLEEHANDLYAAGAIRPRHEWNIWHQDIEEQLRLNREAFERR